MKFTKNIILKNGKICLIRNAVRDDAQEVLNIFLSTHEQTDFLSSYKDEITFDVTLEKQFLTEKEKSYAVKAINDLAEKGMLNSQEVHKKNIDNSNWALWVMIAKMNEKIDNK